MTRMFSGAGYGSRTRLTCLGSTGTTDVLTLRPERLKHIIKEAREKIKHFLKKKRKKIHRKEARPDKRDGPAGRINQ